MVGSGDDGLMVPSQIKHLESQSFVLTQFDSVSGDVWDKQTQTRRPPPNQNALAVHFCVFDGCLLSP